MTQKLDEVKLSAWRPRAFNSAIEMERLIQLYFDTWKADKIPITWVGLASFLGVLKEALRTYETGKYDDPVNDFSSLLKRAREHIEQDKWEKLLTGEYKAAGAIFDLKNHHGAVDTIVNVVQNNNSSDVFKVDVTNMTLAQAAETYKNIIKNC